MKNVQILKPKYLTYFKFHTWSKIFYVLQQIFTSVKAVDQV